MSNAHCGALTRSGFSMYPSSINTFLPIMDSRSRRVKSRADVRTPRVYHGFLCDKVFGRHSASLSALTSVLTQRPAKQLDQMCCTTMQKGKLQVSSKPNTSASLKLPSASLLLFSSSGNQQTLEHYNYTCDVIPSIVFSKAVPKSCHLGLRATGRNVNPS
jgi:hypothetical protein